MRIALSALQQRDFLTGTGRYLAELYSTLVSSRPETEFLLYAKENQRALYPSPARNGILKIQDDCPVSPPKRALWEFRNFSRILRDDHVDLYHGPANFLPPRKVCPYVVTLHDMVYFHNPKRTFLFRAKYWQWYIRATWRLADVILTDSEFSRQEILKYLPVPPGRIRVIYIGVDERFHAQSPQHLRERVRAEIKVNRPYILYVGRLDPDKNVDRIVAAYHSLVESGADDYDLVISGAREYQTSSVFEFVKNNGLEDRVHFTGYISDELLVPLYQEASAFCFPSLNEGFGLPVLEAMAAGVPVVTSNISSLPEVIGDAGIQADPFSVDDIAKGLRTVLTPANRVAFSQAGRERARNFTWQRCADETWNAYQDVLQK